MKRALILLIPFFIISSCSKHRPAPVSDAYRKSINSGHSVSKQNKYKRKYITVKKGDTLYSIGFNNDIDYKRLAQINGIRPPYRIYPGQKIKLYENDKTIAKTTSEKPLIENPTNNQKTVTTTQKTVDNTSTTNKTVTPQNKPVTVQNKPITKKPITQKTPPLPNASNQWIWPVQGKVISSFSSKDVSRKGIDISTPLNKQVVAANSGTVVYSGDGLRGYGELIIIKHQNNLLSAYAHNSKRLVKEGENVKQGQAIASSGKDLTGTPLLHFEIRKNGQPVNPLGYLPK